MIFLISTYAFCSLPNNPEDLLRYQFKFVALFFEPFDGSGKCTSEVFLCFYGIVKHEDRSVAGISFYILQDLLRRFEFAVIACNYIPHHNLKSGILEPNGLRISHMSVRRTKEIGVD